MASYSLTMKNFKLNTYLENRYQRVALENKLY